MSIAQKQTATQSQKLMIFVLSMSCTGWPPCSRS